MGHVFVSYAREDRPFVSRLVREMRARDIPVWDDSHIEHGQAWYRTIEHQLDESDAVVLVMTGASRDSDWVTNELLRAQRKGIPVRPLLVGGEPWLAVESLNFIDLREGGLPDDSFFDELRRVTTSPDPGDSDASGDWLDAGLLLPGGQSDRSDPQPADTTTADTTTAATTHESGASHRRRLLLSALAVAAGLAVVGGAVYGVTRPGEDAATPAPSPTAVASPTASDGPTTDPTPTVPTGTPSTTRTATSTATLVNEPGGDVFRVNFQRRSADTPEGWLVDFGQPFGEQPSGLAYGWVEPGTTTPMDMTAHARDRDQVEDQLRDTLMHVKNWNPATQQTDVGAWEFAVDDGTWLVRVVVGEPTVNDNRHNLTVEGVAAITDFVSSRAGQAQEDNTVLVEVADGRLTFETIPEGVTKIAFTEFERVP
jgi:hypothetical protein